jgi:hypothetical protein
MARISPVTVIDNGVAALAAASAGFLAFAMPDDLFSRIVVRSRIPEFLAAAQPPLGLEARLAIVCLVAIVAYAFVWAMLRALDKIGASSAVHDSADEQGEFDAPRLRRADAHPDAPARRPLLAARELGEPEEELTEPEDWMGDEPATPSAPPASAPPSRPVPAFLVPQDEMPDPVDTVPAEIHAPDFPPTPAAPASVEQVALPAEAGVEEEEPDGSDSEIGGESLARLMNRFETGLSRKQQALVPDEGAPANVAAPEGEAPGRIGHRLRSAISDLNRTAAGGR